MRAARVSVLLVLTVTLLALAAGHVPLHAQISAEEQRKRELFLRARESINPAPARTPRSEPVRPKPRPRPTAETVEKPPAPVVLPPPRQVEPPRATPTPRPKATPRLRATPRETPPPEPVIKLPPPRPASTPRPSPSPRGRESQTRSLDAPIVVEKSGLAEDEGLAPVPKRERRGLFGWGGRGPRYRYLTPGVRAAIDRAPVKRGRWQYVIVHNSATRQGNARIFANYHQNVRKMKNGLAYHFVIGNGTSSGDGEIEIGSRWTRQINGGHVASDYLNNISLGICFVGDFDRDVPTRAQLAALEELIDFLRRRVGRSKGRQLIVKGHREINPRPTSCPGKRFPYRWMHQRFN
ncbi:MAG: peptidoglycan recognition family protein [Chthoniobacterales bacterium]